MSDPSSQVENREDRWRADLLAAGWQAIRHDTWKRPDGALFRGPYGAWCELQRSAEPQCEHGVAMDVHSESAEAQLARMQWQPIDSAPKDGTEVLVWLPQRMLIRQVRYTQLTWTYATVPGLHDLMDTPSHWMPLPTAPEIPHVE